MSGIAKDSVDSEEPAPRAKPSFQPRRSQAGERGQPLDFELETGQFSGGFEHLFSARLGHEQRSSRVGDCLFCRTNRGSDYVLGDADQTLLCEAVRRMSERPAGRRTIQTISKEQVLTQDATITTRLATPADIASLTELHCASLTSEESVLVAFGKRYVGAMHRWQVNSEKGYTVIAESEGKMVGFCAFYSGPYSRPMFMACFGELLLSVVRNPFLLFNKSIWQRLFRRPQSADDSWNRLAKDPAAARGICTVVAKEFRGKGVFPALIEASKPVAESHANRAILVGVYKTNRVSLKASTKVGFMKTRLETADTVIMVLFLDPTFPEEFGIPRLDETGD